MNAIYGWVKTIWRLQDLVRPQKTFAFFDLGKSTARLEIYPEYKANRAPTPKDLQKQILPILEISKTMGIGVLMEENVEADDFLASFAVQQAEAGASVAVASADKDFTQIIGGSIVQWTPVVTPLKSDWQPMDSERVMAKWGIPPEAMVDFLSLVGDVADNIRGIRRVGAKTAGRLLRQYGSIDGILAHANELPAELHNQLHQDEELLRRNQRLVRFNLSAEPLILEVPARRNDDFYKLLLKYELPSLMQTAMERDSCVSQALLSWVED